MLAFRGDRWAGVFVATLGENAGTGLLCLKALVPPARAIPGDLSGYSAAQRLEKTLRESVRDASLVDTATAGLEAIIEFVIRFFVLLVERGRFRHVESVLAKIEERIDTQNGVLAVTLESATPLDNAFAEEFGRRIAERLGVREVRMKALPVPELLGGYRLRVGALVVDASLKKQVEKMKDDLEAAALACGFRA